MAIALEEASYRMTRVFVTQPVPPNALSQLRAEADVEVFPDNSRILPYDDLLQKVGSADILYCLLHDRVDAGVIEAGRRLKLIATSAINPANVDVKTATARKIPVTVCTNIVFEATADLQWALLMATARRIVEADRAVRRGLFPGSQSTYFVGSEVVGKTLGTIGCGMIGGAICRRAQGFAMQVLYNKRHRLTDEQEKRSGVQYRNLDDLLRESDFVVINASLHPGTHHLIGARELALMKPTAFLINTARGTIVDEQALVDALAAKRIAGAGLDVYEQEPKVHPGLLALDNVVLTPHLGSAARDTREQVAAVVVANILAFLRGDRPPNLFNPEVLP